MSIGASIFLIAVGAIVRYAFTFNIEGIDREALGLILMIAGAVGLAMSILYQLMWSNDRRKQEAYYEQQQYQQQPPPPAAPDDRTRRLR